MELRTRASFPKSPLWTLSRSVIQRLFLAPHAFDEWKQICRRSVSTHPAYLSISPSLVHRHSLNLLVPFVSNRVCRFYLLYFSTPPLLSLLDNFLPDLVSVFFDTVSITASHTQTHSHSLALCLWDEDSFLASAMLTPAFFTQPAKINLASPRTLCK